MSDGLFCGDGAFRESIDEREKCLQRILRYRGLDGVTAELVKIAWENGHDAGIVIERRMIEDDAQPTEELLKEIGFEFGGYGLGTIDVPCGTLEMAFDGTLCEVYREDDCRLSLPDQRKMGSVKQLCFALGRKVPLRVTS